METSKAKEVSTAWIYEFMYTQSVAGLDHMLNIAVNDQNILIKCKLIHLDFNSTLS